MSLQHAMDSDADGAILSPTSSDQSNPGSVTAPGAQSQDLEALVEDTEMSELLDTNLQTEPARLPPLSNANLVPDDQASDLTTHRPSSMKPTRTNPPRGKGKSIMVGGVLVESGGSGNSRSRTETRPSNSRSQFNPSERVGGGDPQDGHRGAKVLDEHYLAKCDFGDPFLDRLNARQRSADELAMAQPAPVPPTDNSQNAPVSAAESSDLPTTFEPPLPPSEVIAPSTPAASPS